MFGSFLPPAAQRAMKWNLLIIALRREAKRLKTKPVLLCVISILPNDFTVRKFQYGRAWWGLYSKRMHRALWEGLENGIDKLPYASYVIVDEQRVGLVIAIGPLRQHPSKKLRQLVEFRPDGYEDLFRTD